MIGSSMLILFFVKLSMTDASDQILSRYAALRAKAPAVEVWCVDPAGKSHYLLVPNKRARFEYRSANSDYVCVISEKGTREIENKDRQYNVLSNTLVGAMPSKISGSSNQYPSWIYPASLQKLLPGGAKFSAKGQRTVRGQSGDVVEGNYSGPDGKVQLQAVIDSVGAPLYILYKSESPLGSQQREWTVDKFLAVPIPSPQAFELPFPNGYTPYSVESIDGPAGVGTSFPMGGWTKVGKGNLDIKPFLSQGGLVAILGTESEPSMRSLSSLGRIKASGMPVVVLSDSAPRQGLASVVGYDATGKQLDLLKVPSTPVFYRLDANGVVKAVWLGYDPTKAKQFEQDVIKK